MNGHRWVKLYGWSKTICRNTACYSAMICRRSSYRRCSVGKGVLRSFAKLTGKHLCQSLFFNKIAGLSPATLLKKRLLCRGFPVNFAKFLRTHFLQNTSERLLLMQYQYGNCSFVWILLCSYSQYQKNKTGLGLSYPYFLRSQYLV